MRKVIGIFLILTMACYGATPLWATALQEQQAKQQITLDQILESSYLELFEASPDILASEDQIKAWEEQLEEQKDQEEENLDQRKHDLDDRIEATQDALKQLNRRNERSPAIEEERHALHCQIQQARNELREVKLALDTGLDLEFDNKFAKLKIIEEWPQRYSEVMESIQQNRTVDRKFGDFRDIGFRSGPFEGQEEDVERGREAIDEMKRMNILPPEVEDQEIVKYVREVASRVARHSDLRVPLQVTVLKSKEINAFALPGGFLFVNAGLIEQAGNESQLAGVLAHEIAHVTARHGDRLMGKATIANIVYSAAQIAALIFTGGISSIATYYLFQYGFYGLGLVLSLSLLGVSRDYEIEADILGTQYLWASNYDTDGFMEFFGKMAQEKGYVVGLSWFRTHPPFYERMAETYEEILYLPRQEDPVVNTARFQEVQERLERVMNELEEEDREAPTLRRVYDCDSETEESQTTAKTQGR